MHLRPIPFETIVSGSFGKRHEIATGITREQHARFLEELTHRSDEKWSRLCRVDFIEPSRGFKTHGRLAIAIVHAAAGKHIRTGHEGGGFVPPDHEDLRRRGEVPHHDNRRRLRNRTGRDFAHAGIMNRVDTNGLIASLLRDMAAAQTSQQSRWGYKRAAAAIRNLEEPIESLVQPDGTLRKIANIGPSSARVILEVLRTGRSETVERALAASGRGSDVAKSRDLRGNFLTRAQVLAALRNAKLRGPKLADYRGDLQMHSTWSDGSQTLEDIVDAGLARGYKYCAVTDHSYGL